jgi:hypothetical protein
MKIKGDPRKSKKTIHRVRRAAERLMYDGKLIFSFEDIIKKCIHGE